MKARTPLNSVMPWVCLASLAACGPGSMVPQTPDASMTQNGDAGADAGAPALDAGPSLAQRQQAAATTARTNSLCLAIMPFYWEVGDQTTALATGSEADGGLARTTADTAMPIASATKLLYASYWVQRVSGTLSTDDIKFLTFQSGYTNFGSCGAGATTVDACLSAPRLGGGTNGDFVNGTENLFSYGGGHLMKHASINGLGGFDNAALAAELRTQLGTEVRLSFNSPQTAGGGVSTAADYAKVLRKVLRGELLIKNLLGSSPVCATDAACGRTVESPADKNEQWSYSLGHWVETDPLVGDGAFSSAGAFGFYPWIDASKTFYGVLARRDLTGAGAGADSVRCGRLIRKAFVTGRAQ